MLMFSFRRCLGLSLALAAGPTVAADLHDAALVLPLKGRLAKAATVIRDGFLAGYYQDLAQHHPTPIVRIYDNGEGHGVTLVNIAAYDGAELVVGPLDKEQVAELADAGNLPVPVLALNRSDNTTSGLYQFALAPEDELGALVALLRLQGAQRVRVFQQNDAASERNRQFFEQRWQAAGGELEAPYVWAPGSKGGVSAAVRQMLAENKGKRIDAIFLATPGLSKQVRPSLNYYYARQLPLYTLSSSYDVNESAVQRQDLNGIRFCDQPWIIDGGWPEQETLYTTFGRPASSFDRLYAFGGDAYALAKSLYQQPAQLDLKGRSGQLKASENGWILRDLSCVEVRDGNAETLSTTGKLATTATRP